MTSTTIIYLIISVLSLILGFKTKDANQIQNAEKTIEKIIDERKHTNDIQQNEMPNANATDIRP